MSPWRGIIVNSSIPVTFACHTFTHSLLSSSIRYTVREIYNINNTNKRYFQKNQNKFFWNWFIQFKMKELKQKQKERVL